MKNEPVAWFEQDPDMKSVWYQADQDSPNAIPLYTHPTKTLTDEEILNIAHQKITRLMKKDLLMAWINNVNQECNRWLKVMHSCVN